jgi:transcriptional regulator with PAS, ATPase and Fis domain
MDNLILTGWFWKDYAIAAAVALRHYKKADIKAVSTRRLPEFLNEVGTKYKEIAILGVGLANNIELLDKALTKLQKNKVKVRWISSLDFPDCVDEKIRKKLDSFICYDDGITEAVSQCFNVPYGDIAPLIRNEVSKDIYIYHELIDAASYSYRNYQNETDYGWVVNMISRRETEASLLKSDWATKLLQHYRRYGHRELVGKSQVIMDLQSRINRIAPRDKARVFIYGESGTGKETIAILIHNKSPRRDEPFCSFNCASVTPNLLEDRFFGHEKGAYTGANEQKKGLFEIADGGTLFLDEIGEMPLEAQGVLLRVLEGGRFTRVGGSEEISVDVRLITATNRDLAELVREGKFREDLYHRLCVVQIHAPSLRDHKEDISQIANGRWLKEHQCNLTHEQIEVLKSYDYPGNVRELNNILDRASVLGESDFAKLLKEHKEMTVNLRPASEIKEEVPDELEAAIRIHVKRVYEKYDKNLTRTADALNVARNTVKKYLED